jgi:hypothetical protein
MSVYTTHYNYAVTKFLYQNHKMAWKGGVLHLVSSIWVVPTLSELHVNDITGKGHVGSKLWRLTQFSVTLSHFCAASHQKQNFLCLNIRLCVCVCARVRACVRALLFLLALWRNRTLSCVRVRRAREAYIRPWLHSPDSLHIYTIIHAQVTTQSKVMIKYVERLVCRYLNITVCICQLQYITKLPTYYLTKLCEGCQL